MCNLSEGIVDRVTEHVTREITTSVTKSVTESVTKNVAKEVTLKNRIETVKALMRNAGWKMKQAMAVLDIPESMRLPIMKALAN